MRIGVVTETVSTSILRKQFRHDTPTTLMDGTLAWVALPFAAPRYLAAFMRLHGIARIMWLC